MPFNNHLNTSRTRGPCSAVPFTALQVHEFIRLKQKTLLDFNSYTHTERTFPAPHPPRLTVTAQPVYITICLAP